MAAPNRGTPAAVGAASVEPRAARDRPPAAAGHARPLHEPNTLAWQLFAQGYDFDFFQAVRILEKLEPKRVPVGRGGPPSREVVRFRAHASLAFPPSSIFQTHAPDGRLPMPLLIVNFLGLTGPSGVLPRHYTELLQRNDRESKHAEKHALRDWMAMFDHRLISLFYRAWEKYRFYIPYERGEYALAEADPFTRGLFSLIGLGMPSLRGRLAVSVPGPLGEPEQQQRLAAIDDLALLHYSGFLAHRPRNAVSLEAMLQNHFQLPVRIQQFTGQWLRIGPANQSRMADDANNQLGLNVVAGERVWDVQSKFRVRIGPLRFPRFNEFLPDPSPVPRRKMFFLLSHLVRLYVGPELDFDVQLILQAVDVPECRLDDGDGIGPRLGWNTWICSQPAARDAEDGVFEGDPRRWLNDGETIHQA